MTIQRFAFVFLLSLLIVGFFPGQGLAAVCGNSQCEDGENSCSCPSDCGKCEGDVSGKACQAYYCTTDKICSIKFIPNCCGNNACELSDKYDEDFGSCPADCAPRVVNIRIISPEDGYKVRYGEELFYKAEVDADGRSIAGIRVNVSGFIEEFELYNDGLHDDGAFSDNVFGGYAGVPTGLTPGRWEVDFNTNFRNVDGNNSVVIEVFPFVDAKVDVPAEIELGDNFNVVMELSINGKPVVARTVFSIIDDRNNVISDGNVSSGADGKIGFSYRSTLIDHPGIWRLVVDGSDLAGNMVRVEKRVVVYNPGETPERRITYIKTPKESYVGGETFEAAVHIEEEGKPLESVLVVVKLLGERLELVQIGSGDYVGSLRLPVRHEDENVLLEIQVYNESGGLIAGERRVFSLGSGTLNVEVVSPIERVFESGDDITFTAVVTYSDGSLADNATVYAVFNNQKLVLSRDKAGVYSAVYRVNDDEGAIQVTVTAETGSASSGEAKTSYVVSGRSAFYGLKENLSTIMAVVAGLIIIAAIAMVIYKRKSIIKDRKAKLAEIEESKRTVQNSYFREKRINKEEYMNLMDKYDTQKRELE